MPVLNSFDGMVHISVQRPSNNGDPDQDKYGVAIWPGDGRPSWSISKGSGRLSFSSIDGVIGVLAGILLSHPMQNWVVTRCGSELRLEKIESHLSSERLDPLGNHKLEIVQGIREDVLGEICDLLLGNVIP